MRKLIISLVSLLVMHCVVAQNTDRHNFLDRFLSDYVTINEISFGIGLGEADVPFSRAVFDVTTIHGYKINKNFITSLGTGFAFYNEGGLLPLFADIRYIEDLNLWRHKVPKVYRISPYLYTKAGVLLPVYGAEQYTATRLFISPGLGMKYNVSRNLSVNFGAGLFAQFGSYRDSFIKIKTGIAYRPVRRS